MSISPIFVFDVEGRVVIYDNVNDAEQSLEAIDITDDEYPIAYDTEGRAYQVLPHLDNARLLPLDRTDTADLRSRLSRAPGPRNLADNPYAYADDVLSD